MPYFQYGNGGVKRSLVLNKDINQLMDDLKFLAREQLVPLSLLEASFLYARDSQNVAYQCTVLQQSYKQSELLMPLFETLSKEEIFVL
ncbi:hypothetical protein GBA52_003939 [Prunus armeniaca]|nr:hypothetical protein GBA52_003939 [Prunus armeniaca]